MESAGPTGSPPETSRREARVEHHRLDPTRPEIRDPDPHPGPVHQVSRRTISTYGMGTGSAAQVLAR